MRRRALVSAVFALPLAGIAAAARVTGERAMRRCTVHEADTLAALKSGQQRLAVTVRSYRPAGDASGAIVVFLVAPDGTRRREIARFALHPPRGFGGESEPRRFLVSLERHVAALRQGEPLCIEVGLGAAGKSAADTAAEIDVEVVDRPGGP